MKKKAIIAFVVAALVALQAPMVALAATDYHGADLTDAIACKGDEFNNIGSIHVDKADAITASSGGTVQVNGSVISDTGTAIFADGTGTSVTVGGDVAAPHATCVSASNGSTVHIGSATGSGGVQASGSGTVVTVDNDVVSTGATAAMADKGAKVAIKGKAESTSYAGVYAAGSGTEVIVNNAIGKTYGVDAENGAVVTVYGECSGATGVYVVKGATVYANDVEASEYGIYVVNGGATVVCTGTVKGDMYGIYVNDPNQPYDVTVYAVESQGKALSFEPLRDGVKYIIKDSDDSATYKNMTFKGCDTVTTPDGKTYFTSKEGTITVTVADGYKLNGTTDITGSGNVYTVTIPCGGGVTLEAILDAIEKKEKDQEMQASAPVGTGAAWTSVPVKAGSASAPIANGTWKPVNGTFQYIVDGAVLKNALAVITYIPAGQTQPVTGTYYFDKSGNMAMGWQLIDGLWYYFNTVAGATQGALLTNTITPDGYKVGADGAWIQ